MLIDINPNMELPSYELVLCKPNKEPIQELVNIDDFEAKVYFANIDEISFRVPRYRTESNGTKVENEIYDLVDGSMLVLVNNMKYFVLTKPVVVADNSGEIYKSIIGFSREYETAQKKLIGYDGVSRKIYDYANTKDENGLEIGFLNYVERVTSWRVGYINANILKKYRHLSFPNNTLLQAFPEVQKSFGCIFKFDTVNKIIDVYEATQLGTDNGLYISDGNFINKISQEINHDEIKTRLYLYGKDNISINSINITGLPYIENFDFFKNTKYMSQGLIDALNAYDEHVKSKEGVYNSYLSQLEDLYEQLSVNKIELNTLKGDLTLIEINIDIAISDKQPTDTLLAEQEAKKAEIASKENIIDNLTTSINQVYTNIEDLWFSISLESHLTEGQLQELDPFIREEDFSDSNFTEDNLSELLDEGRKILQQISYPKIQFNVDVDDFLSLVEAQHIWEKFILGDIVNLEYSDINFNYKVRLIGYTHKPDSNQLSLIFSNTNSVDDADIYLGELLASLSSTASTVDFSRYKWDKGEQAKTTIDKYVDSALDLSKQAILRADGQKPLVDHRGIWMTKENPDGSIDPKQMRIINNILAITNNNWKTVDAAITGDGVLGRAVIGELGVFATVQANQILVDNEPNPNVDYSLMDYINDGNEVLNGALQDLEDEVNASFSNNIITQVEANSIRGQFATLKDESNDIINIANSYGASYTSYTNALNQLEQLLYGYVDLSNNGLIRVKKPITYNTDGWNAYNLSITEYGVNYWKIEKTQAVFGSISKRFNFDYPSSIPATIDLTTQTPSDGFIRVVHNDKLLAELKHNQQSMVSFSLKNYDKIDIEFINISSATCVFNLSGELYDYAPVSYPMEINNQKRQEITTAFKNLSMAKTKLTNAIIEKYAVKIGEWYNGVKIDDGGVTVTRSDGNTQAIMNATEGYSLYSKIDGVMSRNFYVDTDGKIQAKNIVIDGSGTFKGRIEANEGIFKGDITGATGTFSGVVNASDYRINGVSILENNKIKGNYIKSITTDQLTAGVAKITTSMIENLVVGSNVSMGANASISWSQITNQPSIPSLPSYITSTKITSTSIESPNITGGQIIGGEIIGGSITSNSIINITTDANIGGNLYLNATTLGEGIHFNTWNPTSITVADPQGGVLIKGGMSVDGFSMFTGEVIFGSNVTFTGGVSGFTLRFA